VSHLTEKGKELRKEQAAIEHVVLLSQPGDGPGFLLKRTNI